MFGPEPLYFTLARLLLVCRVRTQPLPQDGDITSMKSTRTTLQTTNYNVVYVIHGARHYGLQTRDYAEACLEAQRLRDRKHYAFVEKVQ